MACCNSHLYIIAISSILFMILHHFKSRIFAAFTNWWTSRKGVETEKLKKELFKSLHDIVSHDPELRKEKAIKILEIGVGTGINFNFYPDLTRLVAVDPNPHFAFYYNKNRSEFPHIHSEEIINTTGDKMKMIENNSVDAVVMTQVLCSVDDIGSTLAEIKRVLISGGKFYFMEHVKEPNKNNYIKIILQEILTKTRIWPFIFEGCMLNRELVPELTAAGFKSIEKSRFKMEVPTFMAFVEAGIFGVAVK